MSHIIKPLDNTPAEMRNAQIWTPHKDKRPLAEPGAMHKCMPLEDACAYARKHDYSGVGVNFSMDSPLGCIDIDAPKDPQLQQARDIHLANYAPHSQEYAEWLLQQSYMLEAFDNTGLRPILTMTYVELSPSLLGLHIWCNVIDKDSTQSAYIKSKHPNVRGQFSLTNSFMTSTGIQLAGSASMLAPVSVYSFPKVFNKTKTATSDAAATTKEPD